MMPIDHISELACSHISTALRGHGLEPVGFSPLSIKGSKHAKSLCVQLQVTRSCKSLGQRRLHIKPLIAKEIVKTVGQRDMQKHSPLIQPLPHLKLEPGKSGVKTCHSDMTT